MFSSNATQVSAVTQAEAVDFDGQNGDILSSSIGLSGQNTTISFWVWGTNTTYYALWGDTGYFRIEIMGGVTIDYYELSNSQQRLQYSGATQVTPNTWNHILISIAFAQTSTNSRVYINDIQSSGSWPTFLQGSTFAISNLQVGKTAGTYFNGRLSNVFLDRTYRDLSITANRRLFVTADLKPAAGQAALNPILYLPMSDPTTVGTNAGTGGNFTLTGTIARSGRGPNQYNAPMSMFDGVADYLGRTSLTGIANGKQFTFSCAYRGITGSGGAQPVLWIGNAPSISWYVIVDTLNKDLNIIAKTAANVTILSATIRNNVLINARNLVVTVSVDLTDTAKRHVYINGTLATMTWTTYTNDNIAFIGDTYNVARNGSATYTNAYIGAIWFNTSYIDLSVASNLAKFVSGTGIDAKPVDLGATGELPTGTSPLIYLPMYGNNAGKNYGTGGNFTVNSGPYTGARGPNEFWGNKANFGATTSNYLSRSTALVGNPGGVTTATFCCYFYCNNAATTGTLFGFSSAASGTWQISANRVFVWLGSGYVEFNENVTSSAWHSLLFSRTGSTITAYLDGVALTINSGSSYDYGGAIQFAQTPVNIGVRNTGSSRTDPMNGQISELYLSSSYIDFSQEANRLKFRDCFGNPVDLSAQITAQSIPTPIVYARFPPTAFGTNSGTGGDFTVSGTISDGGQL